MNIDKRIRVNGIPIKSFVFPGGEVSVNLSHIKGLHTLSFINIFAYIQTSDDLMKLIMTVDSIRRINIVSNNIELELPYFPYSRQDRICNIGESLSVEVMVKILSSLNFYNIKIYDPHSSAIKILFEREGTNIKIIDRSDIFIYSDFVRISLFFNNNNKVEKVLISPDEGAKNIVEKIAVNERMEYISFRKVREISTGEITGIKLEDEFLETQFSKETPFLIIDDICDGGRTFIEVSKELKKLGAEKIELYVTNGIFSEGLDVLKDSGIDHIYCLYTFLDDNEIDTNYLTILENS